MAPRIINQIQSGKILKSSSRRAWSLAGMALFSLALAILPSCSPDLSQPERSAYLVLEALDTLMIAASDWRHEVRVRVEPAAEAVGKEVFCRIIGEYDTAEFQMFDDGGFFRALNDDAPFADSISGDTWAGDGMFTRIIRPSFAPFVGTFVFNFILIDSSGSTRDSILAQVELRLNSLPEILETDYPDSIDSGSGGHVFYTRIVDGDGQLDIARVQLTVLDRPGVYYLMQHQPGWVWRFVSGTDQAVALRTGTHRFQIRAQDRFLFQTGTWISSDIFVLWLENLPPVIDSFSGPDTVWLEPGDSVTFEYIINISDPQGVYDLDTLWVEIQAPNRQPLRLPSLDTADWELGTVAHDGEYVRGFSATSTSQRNVLFTLYWTPKDKTLQEGNQHISTLIILDSPPSFKLPGPAGWWERGQHPELP